MMVRWCLIPLLMLQVVTSISLSQPKVTASEVLESLNANLDDTGLICSTYEFNTRISRNLLTKIAGLSFRDDCGVSLFRSDANRLVCLAPSNSIQLNNPDISLVYLHPSLLLNEEKCLGIFHSIFEGTFNAESSRRHRILVIMNNSEEGGSAERKVIMLLSEAWALFNKGKVKDEDFNKYFEFRMIYSSDTEIASKTIKSFSDFIASVESQRNAKGLVEELIKKVANQKRVTTGADQSNSAGGISFLQAGVDAGVNWARDVANANTQKLNKPEVSAELGQFMSNLIGNAQKVMTDAIAKQGPVSASALSYGVQDLRRQIFFMMSPFHKRHITLLKQAANKKFSSAVEDLEVTINVMEDLLRIRDDALGSFRQQAQLLCPKGIPSGWESRWEEQQLRKAFDDFIASREEFYKGLGVLQFKRKPIGLSMHTMLLHPLGRDHRQEPLGVLAGDEIDYDEEVARLQEGLLIHPRRARPLLVAQSLSVSAGDRRVRPQDAEFAREMLMFPLSMKNPSVPLMGGRSKRRRELKKALLQERDRSETGPERFIRWDLKPLDEAKNNLEALRQNYVPEITTKTKIVNSIPGLKSGYYIPPPLNHQKQPGGEKLVPVRVFSTK